MRLVWGTVARVLGGSPGVQQLEVALDVSDAAAYPSVSYTALTGTCAEGDRVLVNTTAGDLGLGTGSAHFVVARGPVEGEAASLSSVSGGHIMKLRYTPLQHDVLAVEEPAGEHHATMSQAEDLAGMPVVCCGLHSQIAHVAAALKAARPDARVAYVMSDAAALPLALSRLVRDCRTAGLIDVTLSAGQAFGGEIEAVNVHSALLAARHVAAADAAIVALGPGIVGTATPFGHGGTAQGEAINATAALGGRPVAVLRLSFAEARARHRVVSHHTIAALARVALAPAIVAVPALPPEQAEAVETALESGGVWERHEAIRPPSTRTDAVDLRGVDVRTMGRGPADDPAFFAAAAAAGAVAADLLGD